MYSDIGEVVEVMFAPGSRGLPYGVRVDGSIETTLSGEPWGAIIQCPDGHLEAWGYTRASWPGGSAVSARPVLLSDDDAALRRQIARAHALYARYGASGWAPGDYRPA